MARVVTVTSGKGGVGKTTTTANLAVALAALGQRVVALDADIGLRNLDVVMGLENRIVFDVVDAAEGRCRVRQALIRDKRLPELFLLPASQTRDKDALEPAQMVALCDQLREEFDFVIVDSPAGIEGGFRVALAPADEVLIVTTPEVSAVRDADRVTGLVEAEEKEPPRLVINRVKPSMVKRGDMLGPQDVADILSLDVLGMVPEDDSVVVSSNQGAPLVLDERNRASKAFRNMARRLTGETVTMDDLVDDNSISERLRRWLGW